MAQISPNINVMIRAAEKAGRALIRDFGEIENLQVSRKGPADFVSSADKRSEEIIFEELKKTRPDFGFLMEEGGVVEGKDKDSRWIVDPLDGTSNFLHGIPHWAISIALEQKGVIVAGVVYDPVKNEMFHAEKGGNAFLGRRRLRVSGRSDFMSAIIATGAPRATKSQQERFLREYTAVSNIAPAIRRYGAAALDLAYIAAGRFDGFWERDLKSWDVAAGYLIVKEAGGYVYDLDRDPNDPVHTGNILAANEGLYRDLKKVLKAAS